MRIVAMSDSHGDFETVRRIVECHIKDTDLFIHLGDGVLEFCRTMEQHPGKEYAYVVGNHEDERFHWNHCENTIIRAEGHRFFLCHGDTFHVKLDLLELHYMGRRAGADVVLFGHTHVAFDEEKDGVRLINPGALCYPRNSEPSYAVIDVTGNKVTSHFVCPTY